MKLVRRTLKLLGLVLLLVASHAGALVGGLYLLNGELVSDAVEDTRRRFGEFGPTELIKTAEVGSGKLVLVSAIGRLLPERFALASLATVRMYAVAYKSDGLVVTGILVVPKAEGRFPVILFNRGGNREFGRLGIREATMMMAPLASEGYVVVASNYRGNGGSEGLEEFGGSDVRDVLNLIPALEQIEQADRTRVGMLGFSRGGMMTYLALRQTDELRAAVVMSGVGDLFHWKEFRPEMEEFVFSELIPGYDEHPSQALEERSVVFWCDELDRTAPLLVVHGTADERVEYENAKRVADALTRHDHPFQFVTAVGDRHNLARNFHTVRQRSVRWFDEYLRDLEPFHEAERFVTLE